MAERKRNLIAHALWQERKKERNRRTCRWHLATDTYDEEGYRYSGERILQNRFRLATGLAPIISQAVQLRSSTGRAPASDAQRSCAFRVFRKLDPGAIEPEPQQ